ncbi:glucan biosynthesis protein G [Devosia sp. PTR5]|uniref:Glucan biosynthesis protein G n=1 Tax=Devosia oryzisoli TaxID=2774138 RepID=A0A927FRP5_9HYPH|nr:glucan biosynthesis protein G [Devosia oryzisoli]MBD8064162.1 glucan biosynthesis protein G [Devosia oryzisoli]
MLQIPSVYLSRRTFLRGAGAAAILLSTTTLSNVAWAAPDQSGPFDFESFTTRMRELAAAPYQAPELIQSAFYSGLDYDGYRRVQFNTSKARWLDDQHDYQIHAFPPGWLFKETVSLAEVVDGVAKPIEFTAKDFSFYFDPEDQAEAEAAEFPGIAGFRINYPLNRPGAMDELVSFLGASYFRALGRDNIYGASARGLVLNSWRDGAEEFPRFSEFYIEKPTDKGPLTLYAALESPSVTGAYRFVLTPASDAKQETVIDVTARLFFRADVAELGIAPLTSMFLFAETNRSQFDDYRPQVHDSNGLRVEPSVGLPMWRPLNNGSTLGNTYLADTSLRAFGLYQRDRGFETYQDAGAHYERRPSVRVEPTTDWGAGSVRLIEIPSKLEADDNIVAFWIPAEPIKAGSEHDYSYRLIWGDLLPDPEAPLAYVAETRVGQGGVSGVEAASNLRKFVVDYAGGPLRDVPQGTEFDIAAEVSGGSVVSKAFSRIDANGLWRLVLDVDTNGSTLMELKADISAGGQPLAETWLYQWRGGTTA